MLATIRPSPALCRLSLQPVKLTQSSYSTTASPSHDQRRAARRPKLSHSSPSSASTTTTVVDLRAASTSSPSSTSNSTSSSAAPPDHLDWNTFFALRKTRRRYALASSVLTSASTTMAGISILSQQDIDAIGTQVFGLDPIVVLGLATAGFGAVGWLLGPVFGNAAFNLVNQRYRAQIAKKEKAFFTRIKRFRVDPSSQSFSNPVPDYYGEKIGSVQGYRRWLKDQRAYNRKRESFV